MTWHRWQRGALLCGATLLAVTVTGAGVVVLGATGLAIEPGAARDRPAPTAIVGDRGPLRLTVLGTSLSSAGRYRWPDEVGARLAVRIDRPVEISRVARPGATSTWGAAQVDAVLATDPDVVLVELSVNDADLRHRLTVRTSLSQHERLLAGLQAGRPGVTVLLLTMSPASGPRGWARPFLSRYYAAYVDLAQRNDAGLVDLYPRWRALPAVQQELGDGLHPSDAAATRVVVEPVVEAVASARAR